MNALTPLTPAEPALSRPPCLHCAAALPPGAAAYCCAGCEAAHALVAGLGLDAFYARREAAAGELRPVPPPPLDFTTRAHPLPGGEHRLELLLSGLSCGACVWLIEQALAAEPDILAARISLTTRRLTLRWCGPAERANELVAILARLGFRTAPWSPACLRAADDAEGRALLRALGIAAFGAMNVMLVSVAVWAGGDMGAATRALMHWLAMLIALPVVLLAGLPFYRSAWAALRAGRLNMDMAVSLGVLATTAMSVSETLRGGAFTWFDSATTLLALLLAGRVLNHAGRRRARQAGAQLLALQHGSATRLNPDGSTQTLPLETILPGQTILVAAGEALHLDAVLQDATALLDTAAITGESLPRPYTKGDALPAGATNMGAPFLARVTATLADGSLAAMARLLEQAEQARSRITTLADRAAAIYLPAAHAIALATFLGWWLLGGEAWQAALVPAIAALIITCPCGLAIAVPAVQVVAAGALFRQGVLLARPDALERLASADHVVLDKTGTLTQGRPTLLPGPHSAAARRRSAGLAAASCHPLARALHRACPDATLAAGVQEFPGQGLTAPGMRLGSAQFLGLDQPDDGMALWFAAPGQPPLCFRFTDALRADAPAAIAALKAQGLTLEILSGDAPPAVAAVAAALGLEHFTGGVTPQAKAARLQHLAATGHHPLMIGDGSNDAAALALAHVSACPAGSTQLAQSAADILLTAEGLAPIPAAIATARRAQRIARQNIGLSLAYNALAVPLAVAGQVTPLMAAAVMASSSLIVILNALRAGRRAWTR